MADKKVLVSLELSGRAGNGAEQADDCLEEHLVEIYRTTRPALVGYVRHIVRSRSDAEDIVQTAFLKTFDHARSSRIENLRGWLYRVAHNLAIDSKRRDALNIRFFSQDAKDASFDPAISAEQQSIRHQTVERALSVLNERERACLLLRAEGLSYAEVGEALDISAKSVSVYLARAVKKVRNPA